MKVLFRSLFRGGPALLFGGWAALLLASCGSSPVPEEHLYILPLPGPARGPAKEAGAAAGKGPCLAVLPVKGTGLFQGNLLWARVSSMEVEPWIRHRWALPAPEVVRDALLRWARGTGRFSRVRGDASAAGGGALFLEGRLEGLEEVDAPGGVRAEVRLELTLFRKDSSGRPVRAWEGVVEEAEPVRGRTAADVVRALGRAFQRGMDGALRRWERLGLLRRG